MAWRFFSQELWNRGPLTAKTYRKCKGNWRGGRPWSAEMQHKQRRIQRDDGGLACCANIHGAGDALCVTCASRFEISGKRRRWMWNEVSGCFEGWSLISRWDVFAGCCRQRFLWCEAEPWLPSSTFSYFFLKCFNAALRTLSRVMGRSFVGENQTWGAYCLCLFRVQLKWTSGSEELQVENKIGVKYFLS